MVVDYERAWHLLGELIASKTQHGREATLIAMQEIVTECNVPAGELSRLLRLYSVEVERTRAMSTEPVPDEAPASSADGGAPHSPTDDDLPDHHDGGHDGNACRRRNDDAGSGRVERHPALGRT